MRVGIILITYGGNSFGGIERATHFFARGLRQHGVDVTAITGSLLDSEDRQLDGVKIASIPSLRITYPTSDQEIRESIDTNREAIERELTLLFHEIQPDYVLVTDPVWGVLPLLHLWQKIPCPIGLIFHVCHNADVLNSVAELPISQYFSVSQFLTDEIRQRCHNFCQKTIHLLPNSACITDFRRTGGETDDAILVHSRISEEKGICDAVRAFSQIAPEFSSNLWLCGGKFPFGDALQYRQKVGVLVNSLGLTRRVQVLPNLKWFEIPDCLHKSRLIVLPSHRETFGMAALEAMAAGKPLIVSRAGNLPNLVADAGVIVEQGNVGEIAAAMRLLLADPAMSRIYAERGMLRARSFDSFDSASLFLRVIGVQV